jgi:hypothetical protein
MKSLNWHKICFANKQFCFHQGKPPINGSVKEREEIWGRIGSKCKSRQKTIVEQSASAVVFMS